jgi:acetylglutamate kinase
VLHPDAGRLGEVGAISTVHRELIDMLLAYGRVPVLSSIAAFRGRLLNVNADDLAAALAGALEARALMLLSDTPALTLAGAPVSALDRVALDAAIAHPDVRDGMRPKLIAARAALDAGVGRVHLAAWQGAGTLHALLAGAGPGTRIEAEEPAIPTEVRT